MNSNVCLFVGRSVGLSCFPKMAAGKLCLYTPIEALVMQSIYKKIKCIVCMYILYICTYDIDYPQ